MLFLAPLSSSAWAQVQAAVAAAAVPDPDPAFSLSIPAGFTKSGLPVGMQIVGRSFDEAMLVRIGAAFQRATDHHQKVPKLS